MRKCHLAEQAPVSAFTAIPGTKTPIPKFLDVVLCLLLFFLPFLIKKILIKKHKKWQNNFHPALNYNTFHRANIKSCKFRKQYTWYKLPLNVKQCFFLFINHCFKSLSSLWCNYLHNVKIFSVLTKSCKLMAGISHQTKLMWHIYYR